MSLLVTGSGWEGAAGNPTEVVLGQKQGVVSLTPQRKEKFLCPAPRGGIGTEYKYRYNKGLKQYPGLCLHKRVFRRTRVAKEQSNCMCSWSGLGL